MGEIGEPGVVRYEVEVGTSVSQSFQIFIERFDEWWPRSYTFAGEDLEEIGIEPFYGGRCYERDSRGNEVIWGHVTEWEPPERLAFSWWITPERTIDPDLDRSSEVVVQFEEIESGTRIALEHRHISRHDGDWQLMQAAMASEQGWPMLLRACADLAQR